MRRSAEEILAGTWWELQTSLMSTTDEEWVKSLLEAEKSGQRRKHYIKRIYHRYNRLRTMREQEELHGKRK